MNTRTLFVSIIGIMAIFVAFTVFASNKDDIVYPISVLEGCENEQECRAYCDTIDHIDQCLDFAELHNLFSDAEIDHARKFADVGSGPGNCVTQAECHAYCEDISNLEECLAFAEEHDVMSDLELEEARGVARALRAGAQLPGGCQSKDACEAYCEDISHIDECLAFAEQAGFMSDHELAEARQVAQALASGVELPGGCRSENECDTYCEEPTHIDECIDFAIAAGFIPPEEADIARRIAPLMARGEMPGGCRSEEECEAYCSQEGNIEECVRIFESVGIVSAEEAEMFRKTGGRGPGGCVGREECEAFCNDPVNQDICFAFAREHDLISEDELIHIEEGVARFREGVQSAPPEVAQCLQDAIGVEVLEKIEAGEFLPNQEVGEHMQRCFEELFPRGGGEFGGDHEEGFEGGGPSGLTPEQEDCVRRIIGVGFPTPEQEQQIGIECFAAGDFGEGGFEGEHDGGFDDSSIREPEIHDDGSLPPDTRSFESSIDTRDCISRMIASLDGVPPPDFEQQVRETCYQEAVQRQIEDQTRQQIEDGATNDDGSFIEPIHEDEDFVPSAPTIDEPERDAANFTGAAVEAGKILLEAIRSLLGR